MGNLRACRTCLAMSGRMIDIGAHFQLYLKEVLGHKILYSSEVPPYLCHECAALLMKSYKFKMKCLSSQTALFDILQDQNEITEKDLNSINRQNLQLESNLTYYSEPPSNTFIFEHQDEDVNEEVKVKQEPNDIEGETTEDLLRVLPFPEVKDEDSDDASNGGGDICLGSQSEDSDYNSSRNPKWLQSTSLVKVDIEASIKAEYDDTEEPEKSKKTKRWKKTQDFQCAQDADIYVKSQNLKRVTRYKGNKGERVSFRCSRGKYRQQECPAKFYLLYHANSSKVSLFETNQHANHIDSKRGLKSKKPKKPKKWQKTQEFPCAQEAESYIKSQNLKKVTRYKGNGGERVNFRCSRGKYRQQECPAKFYLLYHANSPKVSLFEMNQHANHIEGKRPKMPRKPNKPKNWKKTQEFQCAQDAESFIKAENLKTITRYRSHEGERVNFRCSRGKYRQQECPAKFYLLYHADSSKVSLFEMNQHDNHTDGTRGIKWSIRETITHLYNDGIQKPKAVLAALRKRNLPEPTRIQLYNFLKTLRTKQYDDAEVSHTAE